jgi:hypothetical protein
MGLLEPLLGICAILTALLLHLQVAETKGRELVDTFEE